MYDHEGVLLEGVVDLCFERAAGEWVVVDYKTDATIRDEAKRQYAAQVGYYCTGLEAALGASVSGVILQV